MFKYKEVKVWIVVIFTVIIISYGGWRIERYVNWKFGYGPKVNRRIEAVEKRVEKLENSLKSEKNSL